MNFRTLFVILLSVSISIPIAAIPMEITSQVFTNNDVLTHSHNDYKQDHPLYDALSARMDSVEVDLWYFFGNLEVSHFGFFSAGTLEDLYLKPLQKLLTDRDSIYGDGKPFYLWIDIKNDDPEFVSKLYDTLNRYPFLTQFSQNQVVQKPVTVILTGIKEVKVEFVTRYSLRPAIRDDNELTVTDPMVNNQWDWYSLDWSDYFDWNGDGTMPFNEKMFLDALVQIIHSKGKKLRFYNTPDNPNFWSQILNTPIDMLSTDHPQDLRQFLTSH